MLQKIFPVAGILTKLSLGISYHIQRIVGIPKELRTRSDRFEIYWRNTLEDSMSVSLHTNNALSLNLYISKGIDDRQGENMVTTEVPSSIWNFSVYPITACLD